MSLQGIIEFLLEIIFIFNQKYTHSCEFTINFMISFLPNE